MNTTTAQITAAVNNWYSPVLLVRVNPAFVHGRWAQVRDLPANAGETAKFRRYGNLTAATTALTEGVTPPGSQLSITDITATPAQYGDYVTTTDKLQFTTMDPLMTETAEILGDQAADTMDLLTRDVLNAGTTVQYASTAVSRVTVTAAMTLNVSEIREAVLTLKLANCKQVTEMIDPTDATNTKSVDRAYIGIAHPRTTANLKTQADFTKVKDYSKPSSAMPDEVGAMDEVRIIESNNSKVFTGAGASGVDVYSTIVFGQNFYGVTRISGQALKNIIKPLGSAGSADPLDQRATNGWKATFVAVRLNEAFAVRIEHGVAAVS